VKDALVFGAMIAAFATLLTAHATIAWGLAARPPRWRALLALFLLPMAPYFALRERMRVRAIAWIGALVGYVLMRFVQR
jgi:hypothetical protein